jgi:hypothetical protein
MNEFEKACREFLKGCSCVSEGRQETCPDCLEAFCNRLRSIKESRDDYDAPGYIQSSVIP